MRTPPDQAGRGPQPQRIARCVFGPQPRTLICERRKGIDVYHSAHRIAAVERALRAAQHLDAFDVRQIEIVVLLREVGNVIDIESHDGLVDACPQSAHIDRRRHARTVIGDVEVGNQPRQLLDGRDALPFDRPASRHRCGYGTVAQRKPLFDRRHLYAVNRDDGVDDLRFVVRQNSCSFRRGCPPVWVGFSDTGRGGRLHGGRIGFFVRCRGGAHRRIRAGRPCWNLSCGNGNGDGCEKPCEPP